MIHREFPRPLRDDATGEAELDRDRFTFSVSIFTPPSERRSLLRGGRRLSKPKSDATGRDSLRGQFRGEARASQGTTMRNAGGEIPLSDSPR